MKNRRLRFLISLVLSLLLVVQSVVPAAADTVVGATGELEEIEALVEVLNNDGNEMALDDLSDDEYDGFIYSLKDDTSRAEIRDMESEISTLSGDAEVEEVVSNEIYTADSLETISEVAAADMIDHVVPDYINRLDSHSSTPNDKYYNDCPITNSSGVVYKNLPYKNVLSAMNVQRVWERGFFGSNDVTVAILDSGVNENHEELVGKVKENLVVTKSSVTKYKITKEDQNDNQSFHASFASGIVCAENNNGKGISGAMPSVNIVSMKIFFKDSTGKLGAKDSDIISAIKLATEKNVDVINMSFGKTYINDDVEDACKAAVAKGLILVASSGNNSKPGETKTATYPAAYNCVIGVGSVDADSLKRSDFSNVDVDVVAPGRSDSSTGYAGLSNSDEEKYVLGKGTSFSGPQVAALAAMAKSIDKDITASEFMSILYGTAVDLGDAGKDAEYGYGLVDFEAVLNELVGEDGRGDGQTIDISSAEVEFNSDGISGVYDGTSKEVEVLSVKLGDRVLTAGQDYSVHYENNISVGTAKLVIKGINKYSGKVVATYDIYPKAATIGTPSRAKTSVTVKWTAQKSKMKTARITGYQVRLARDSKFTSGLKKATVSGYDKTSKTFTKLKRHTKYYVRVRTYMKVGDKTYYSDWSEVKAVKTK